MRSWPYRPLFVWGLLMQLGVASSLDLWRQPHWSWNGSISRAWAADCMLLSSVVANTLQVPLVLFMSLR